ncbi:MAG: histone [Thermoproteota archaeon]|jgi:histone H3/H4|uniref:Histone n=1 Tax=Candidatus Methanodesulfokora washburnensis TaxID=2478471 RepID=A0A429GPR3_9CREN|nr:histone [Candidatus Methanodesulfokores washburnensis]PNV77368.1 MAG: histone [Candidatus Korarchaeota archaeon]RSN75922.1 histone [Candidatus Methanodesulfokores washburnensis]RZN62484.1 MAG: histone [Candidatus Methanodesulfokores washburnensis]TDA39326.1 MAG: histone [Candidatus Korarchaeota archaeon]
MSEKAARYLPLAPVYRIIKDSGAERVSDGARERLAYYMEKLATEVAKHAIDIAKHSKRKTVTSSDIELAVSAILKK